MKYIDSIKRKELLKKKKEELFYRISSRKAMQFAMKLLKGDLKND